MTDTPLRCVVDASVAIKLFVDDPLSDKVDTLFSLLDADPKCKFYVPDLFYIECTNILWKYVRAPSHAYTATDAETAVHNLSSLSLEPTPTVALMSDALKISLAYEITAYDACYVSLARRLGVPLVTADKKLVRALESSPDRVYYLDNFVIPDLP
jgi:predicted nucleic acid-binding protein